MDGKLFCIPETASYGTMIRLYVKYMQDNPKYMDEPSIEGLMIAMVYNYPCPAHKK